MSDYSSTDYINCPAIFLKHNQSSSSWFCSHLCTSSINRIRMRIIILFGLLATAHSEVVFHTGFTNEVDVENFKAFDLNGDGIIHFSETFTTFRDVDTNDDGVWSFEEFADNYPPDFPSLRAQIAFDFMDTLDSAVDGVIDSSVACAFFSIMDVDNNRKAILGEYKNASHQAGNFFKKELNNIAGC